MAIYIPGRVALNWSPSLQNFTKDIAKKILKVGFYWLIDSFYFKLLILSLHREKLYNNSKLKIADQLFTNMIQKK